MKYAMLFYAAPDANPRERAARESAGGAWVDYTREINESGVLCGGEQLFEVETATSVRLREGERLLTDGPFIETKEHLLGFFLIDVPDLDAAIEWASKVPMVGFGTVEVRPVKVGMAWQKVLE
jgi:hypothetical protein